MVAAVLYQIDQQREILTIPPQRAVFSDFMHVIGAMRYLMPGGAVVDLVLENEAGLMESFRFTNKDGVQPRS